jgi:hypothetical protein
MSVNDAYRIIIDDSIVMLQTGKPYRRERLSMVDLLVKRGCFVKKEKIQFQ